MLRNHKLFLVVVTLTSSGAAFAAGGGGGGGGAGDHHAPHVANWWGLLSEKNQEAPALGWMFVTFVTFLAIVYFAARRQLSNYVAARSDEVKAALEEAQHARREAEARAREYEERLLGLDAEVAALKADFKTRGEAELRRLEATGKAAAERVVKDAEDTIAAEVERAQEALKSEAAKLSLELAEERLRGLITADDQQRLEKQFLRDMAQ